MCVEGDIPCIEPPLYVWWVLTPLPHVLACTSDAADTVLFLIVYIQVGSVSLEPMSA